VGPPVLEGALVVAGLVVLGAVLLTAGVVVAGVPVLLPTVSTGAPLLLALPSVVPGAGSPVFGGGELNVPDVVAPGMLPWPLTVAMGSDSFFELHPTKDDSSAPENSVAPRANREHFDMPQR
jgi:hypothetical protein